MTDFGASMAGWIAGLHAGAPALTLLAMFVSAFLVTVCAQRVAGDDFAGLGWPVVVGTTAAITWQALEWHVFDWTLPDGVRLGSIVVAYSILTLVLAAVLALGALFGGVAAIRRLRTFIVPMVLPMLWPTALLRLGAMHSPAAQRTAIRVLSNHPWRLPKRHPLSHRCWPVLGPLLRSPDARVSQHPHLRTLLEDTIVQLRRELQRDRRYDVPYISELGGVISANPRILTDSARAALQALPDRILIASGGFVPDFIPGDRATGPHEGGFESDDPGERWDDRVFDCRELKRRCLDAELSG